MLSANELSYLKKLRDPIPQGNDPDITIVKVKNLRTGEYYVCKYCCNSNVYPIFDRCFVSEYNHMKDIEKNICPRDYCDYFPRYHHVGCYQDSIPYILMDYIPGNTLEEELRQYQKRTDASMIFTRSHILHLFEQLNTALTYMAQGGIMQLDLSTKNIIVSNNQLNIHLIDFTDVHYLRAEDQQDLGNPEPKLPSNRKFHSVKHPPLLLRSAAAELFTRLFFGGSSCYSRNFVITNHCLNQSTRDFFCRYSCEDLLHCLCYPQTTYQPNEDILCYWNSWYKTLRNTLDIY